MALQNLNKMLLIISMRSWYNAYNSTYRKVTAGSCSGKYVSVMCVHRCVVLSHMEDTIQLMIHTLQLAFNIYDHTVAFQATRGLQGYPSSIRTTGNGYSYLILYHMLQVFLPFTIGATVPSDAYCLGCFGFWYMGDLLSIL